MISPRWQKMLRDLRIAQGRVLMMVIAIAVGIFGVGSMLSAYAILTGELNRNYLSTNPASASFELDKVDDSLVDSVRVRPGIANAEVGSIVIARIEKKKDEWLPLLLFVVRDFNNMRINTVKHESGAWPPPKGSMLLERNALKVINAKVGDVYGVKTPSGQKHEVRISGSVHDPGVAPSWQEQTAYGYITPSTVSWLGENSTLHILKVTIKDQPLNMMAIDHTVKDLAGWLKQKGHVIEEIRIPPPGRHPHQHLMETVLMMLIIFGLMALVLSAILTATMVRGLLAQQVRQIGIMKAIGARSRQIAGQYLMLIALVGATAVILGLPLGIAAGRGFSRMMAQLLNIRLYSEGVTVWVYVVLILAGILVPLIVGLGPIFRATQITVREVLNDYGVSRKAFDSRRLFTLLGKIRGIDRTLVLAIRNTFRRRGRLLLTLGLLAAAGGMFITSLNVKTAWEHYLQDAITNHGYDLEIRFNRPEPQQKALAIVANVPGVKKVESWSMAPAAVDRLGSFAVVRTYPDGGHGGFTIRSVSPENNMLKSQLLEGRRLQQDDTNATVLNHMSNAVFPNVKAGDSITLLVNGKPVALRVVGIVRELLTPPTAYVSQYTFAK
ncbi:MAG TPA: FtsX-like permease family protein, partial [Anaerolineae bacterium]|nr:FtsX-like permease family protein [Anaerolineae bacterium]